MSHVLSNGQKVLSDTGASLSVGPLGRIDPRVRVLSAVAFAITVVALSQIVLLLAALAISATLLWMSQLPKADTIRRVALMDTFIIFMLVLLPFTMPGEPIFTLWGFSASWEGLWRAIEIALTANAVVMALMTLVGTLEPVTLGHALYKLRVPEQLVHLLMFTIRYIEVLHEEYIRLRNSMKLRGFRPRSNWHTYRSFGYLVGMMLVRSMERSERILDAMKCRGFSGRILLLERFTLGRADHLFIAGATLAMLCLIAMEVAYALA